MTRTASEGRVVASIADAKRAIAGARAGGARIGFVPTMGALHEGHLRLIDAARARAEFVVLSVFVNPLQFAPSEDLARYPRDLAGDTAKSFARGVDLVFAPTEREMYPAGRVVTIVPTRLHDRWEGAIRPGHFAGVLTVVAKLFNIVEPDVAIFGQKDFQQAALVRAMVRDLDFPIEIVVAPIVRDPEGLALSSRNAYLGAEDRRRALVLRRSLCAVRAAFDAGERQSRALEELAGRVLAEAPAVQLDYLAVVDAASLEPLEKAEQGSVVLLAARVAGTRLLDNTILGVPEGG